MQYDEILNFIYSQILYMGNHHRYTNFPFPRNLKSLENAFERLKQFIEPKENFNFIGHRLGDFFHYPKNLNEQQYIKTYNNTIDLMKKGFNESGLNGLELDLRKGYDGEVYVTHDELKNQLHPDSLEYLSNNTFYKFINYYIENKYYENNKLFIELKVSPKILDIETYSLFPDILNFTEKQLIESIFTILEKALIPYPDKKDLIKKSISFVSFSKKSLEYAFNYSNDIYDTFLIVSTNQFLKKELSPLLYYTPFDENQIMAIKSADWLTGIWFDPFHVDNLFDIFIDINSNREKKLKYYVSTYGMDFNELVNKFKSSFKNSKLPVSGMIFDIL
jgi:glycerophosphoryl diester phosphodiesterase